MRMGAGCAATIALVTGGYLVITTPDSAAGEGNEGGWFSQLFAQVWPAAEDPESGKVNRKRKEDLFQPGPQYEKKKDAKAKPKKNTANKTENPPKKVNAN